MMIPVDWSFSTNLFWMCLSCYHRSLNKIVLFFHFSSLRVAVYESIDPA